ncbi:MAG: hypothetical protein HC936_15545 [Leptolyngbyaceae cyanobacterium SU_3_3]|nr:hypothetical protein [Leptolyngbyaceae cyanobacterium SU_3_3]NJR53076.1 hypothetical protein [Leptolyngbyaceae cyanobacterium CSU_1_3]
MVVAVGRSPGLTLTLKCLVELLEADDEDEYGILKPTDYAFKTVMNLILEANSLLLTDFPKASASTDHQGGIRLAWTGSSSDDELCLFCPAVATAPVDIYYLLNGEEGIEDVISPVTLVKWLNRFHPA